MSLNENEKSTMRARYEDWGVDKVRENLRRPARSVFVSEDHDQFTRDWVHKAELKEDKRRAFSQRAIKLLMIGAAVEFGVAVGLNFPI